MKKILVLAFSAVFMLTSCVSSKKYQELEGRHADLKRENRNTQSELEKYRDLDEEYSALKKDYADATTERDRLKDELESSRKNYATLKDSYDALEENSSAAISENSRQNRQLLAELEEKEQALVKEQARLDKLQRDLDARSRRVNELEELIAAKDAKMNALKDAISKALTNFEGKGLTVEQRDGKVYVSMENKLLFSSGSWAVNAEGRQAVKQLGQVLAENPDIAVLIEGHTDNVPYGGSGPLNDNWDLSTKRATSIVQILKENNNIDPQNLTAAGRGEYAPIATNETAEGRAKNRRIEVILTPKLDEVTKLLNE
ncbi:OmpA family protein [Salegentibacter mishustinae]|uniref:Cell envelope biogenesis protein OmpA n=1 Tax=Salegentibacter mishustinae TaxID=270918 RepID=A0A0Q9Z3M0_9FLAO|nr:OmpA family protein [Salegentibacter mishustinae]KRG27445.1 cell envelope biogenesis protein OmpA [Salegentibacter mishustinae]PNW20497.1 cell envelope biogenesis protein OmpA [Salegentibacter mishustinae]PZX63301.1 chemotaxis protein MotB [Salegentibacter mishustinae]GGW93192.1 cell envelope biogenesis protein OmpA [Salegentibacter mishustinae]